MSRTLLPDLLRLCIASMLTGAAIGVVGTAFRRLLEEAEHWRVTLVTMAHDAQASGFGATVLGVGVAAALARWLVVRFAPLASGSGVQHVEAMMRGETPPAGPAVIPVKFVGGLLAIGPGLALGREGPTVQMGAALGTVMSTRLMADAPDRTIVDAAGAGAGLAVAFNAPIGGSIFVFEELTRTVTPRQVVATIGAAAVAVAVMRLLLGDTQEFAAGRPHEQPMEELPYFLALGAGLGLAGAGYSALTLGCLALADRMSRIPSVLRAGLIGAAVGVFGWFAPTLVGGGDNLVQHVISVPLAPTALAVILVVRVILGPVCYAAATPGGLFAPLLAVGAAAGALYAGLVNAWLPHASLSASACAIVGMAALFTAVVRAPLTGIVLTVEMTGRPDLVLAMLLACVAAAVVATAMGSEPIYDSLRRRMLTTMGVTATCNAGPANRDEEWR